MNEYELVIIVRPELDDPAALAVMAKAVDHITELGGAILGREDWGSRRLAYLIEKQARGHYLMVVHLAQPSAVLELERRLRLDERVMRFLTSCVGRNVDVDARIAAAAEDAPEGDGIRRRFDLVEEERITDEYANA